MLITHTTQYNDRRLPKRAAVDGAETLSALPLPLPMTSFWPAHYTQPPRVPPLLTILGHWDRKASVHPHPQPKP